MAETPDRTEFCLPSLGSDMDSGTIIGWRVGVGDEVHRGDVLLDVDTEKSDIEIEIWHDAVIAEILVEEGTTVPVGTPLAVLAPIGADVAPPSVSTPAEPTQDTPASTPPPPAAPAATPRTPTPPPPTAPVPIPPSGSGGLVEPPYPLFSPTPRTVFWPAPAGLPSRREARVVPTATDGTPPPAVDRGSRIRGVIASLMARSNAEIPHYYLRTDVDMAAAEAWLERHNAERPVEERVLPAAMVLRAVALAAREHREVNGHWVDGAFQVHDSVDLGVAIHLRGGGLVAPAILAADTLALDDLMAALRDLVTRARAGRLRQSEMADASITVTNLGDQGTDAVFGVVFPPQVALVGVGRIRASGVVVDGQLEVRPVATVSVAADHRATDGHVGARFLQSIDRLLQRPEEL